MRLIDADELAKRLWECVQNRKAIVETKEDTNEHEYHLGKMNGYFNALKIVDAAKTIDPVKHGKLLDGIVSFHWTCSECGCHLRKDLGQVFEREDDRYNYCPNCGARMEEAKDETH